MKKFYPIYFICLLLSVIGNSSPVHGQSITFNVGGVMLTLSGPLNSGDQNLTLVGNVLGISAGNSVNLLTTNVNEGTNLYYTDTRARLAHSITTTGTGAATYNNGTGVLNIPIYSPPTPSYNHTPSLTIQTVAAAANGTQISSTRPVTAQYAITLVSTATIAGNQSGYAIFEICATNSAIATDWQEIDRTPNGQAVSLAITLQSVTTGGGHVGGIIPAGWYRRVRSVITAGTPTFTYNSGQEVTN